MTRVPGQRFRVKHDALLLDYLYEIFADQSRKGVKAYLTNGQVTVNGMTETAYNRELLAGDSLVVLPKGVAIFNEVKQAVKEESKESGVEVLYEDDYIIVVNKRNGIPTVSTGKSAGKKVDTGAKGGTASLKSQKKEVTVYSVLMDYMKTKGRAERHQFKKPVYKSTRVFVVHRLDRDTSGVLVFAKDEKTKELLQGGWNNSVQERKYTAVVEGVPQPASGKIVSWLEENPKSMVMISSREEGEGQIAITNYKTVKRMGAYTMVEFFLETGRKNQIRVHASAEMGTPIVGDKKYGAKTSPIKRLALHAGALSFRHPKSGEIMRFSSPVPKEFDRISE